MWICLKKQAELPCFRLKAWNHPHQDNEICFFHNFQNDFKEFFFQENDLLYCNDVCSVIEILKKQHDLTECRLFIDYSKVSLKAVLLYEGNKLPSVSLAHAANIKRFCENMKPLLEKIQCGKFNWNLCGDLKVIALLLGLQLRCT